MNKFGVILLAVFFIMTPVTAQDELPVKPNKVHPLMIGDEVPAVTLVDIEGEAVDLGALDKPAVLVFYRGHW